jgi:hypothetical protein
MRTALASLACFLLAIGAAQAWPQEKNLFIELTKLLDSPDRKKRCSAAAELARFAQVPESVVPRAVTYVKLGIEEAMLPEAGAKRDHPTRETLPVVGDEVSLAGIKANPAQYTDRPFVITGGIKVSDYYNHWFREMASGFFLVSANTGCVGWQARR